MRTAYFAEFPLSGTPTPSGIRVFCRKTAKWRHSCRRKALRILQRLPMVLKIILSHQNHGQISAERPQMTRIFRLKTASFMKFFSFLHKNHPVFCKTLQKEANFLYENREFRRIPFPVWSSLTPASYFLSENREMVAFPAGAKR